MILFNSLQYFYLLEVCTNLIGLTINIRAQRETKIKLNNKYLKLKIMKSYKSFQWQRFYG